MVDGMYFSKTILETSHISGLPEYFPEKNTIYSRLFMTLEMYSGIQCEDTLKRPSQNNTPKLLSLKTKMHAYSGVIKKTQQDDLILLFT